MIRAGSPYEHIIRVIRRAETVRPALLSGLAAGIRVGAFGVVIVGVLVADAVASDGVR